MKVCVAMTHRHDDSTEAISITRHRAWIEDTCSDFSAEEYSATMTLRTAATVELALASEEGATGGAAAGVAMMH